MSNNNKESIINFIEKDGLIHCDTLAKAEFLGKFLDANSYKWATGNTYETMNWGDYREGTCYRPKVGRYGNLRSYQLTTRYIVKNLNELFPNWNNDIYLASSEIKSIINTKVNNKKLKYKTSYQGFLDYPTLPNRR